MKPWEFFLPDEPKDPDPFAWPSASPSHTEIDEDLLERLLHAPESGRSDLEVAVALARLVHQEYEAFATEGTNLDNEQSRLVVRSLEAVLARLNVHPIDLPFRDFETFKRHWRVAGATGNGSWQLRRDLLAELFEPLHTLLDERETRALTSDLATPISPRRATGWSRVDEELNELRRHFETAQTEQDYSNVGNDAVATLEAISAAAYDHARHGSPGTSEPPIANTKDRLSRIVEVEVSGSENAELRKLIRSAIELAQATKHRRSGDRRSAGITADAIILVAHLIRRVRT